MESPRKFNDCYFYYYSTCTKGDNCVFRHEPSALGCETMCTAWQQGKCLDKRCKLRHMELRKNRKQIPCYWENQPGGCRKIHCPFMHKNPEARTDGIAPSQPAPPLHPCLNENVVEQPPMAGVPPPAVPAPVPLLWQQQRQVVLDSALLGVPRHEAGAPFAPLPVDPLVVNFDEESDNESAPSSTPTKNMSDDANNIARSKSQELQLLEKIQAEAAAFYSYDSLPPVEPTKERKIVRTNLTAKYDKVSLDEISGKKPDLERRGSLDFKVLSLDEIRARKKEAIVHTAPITLNLNRKRKLSTQETLTTSGNKIIKVVRSNSIVYKKMDQNASSAPVQNKIDVKQVQGSNPRKRTLSEQTADLYETMDDELIDNCYEFKRVKITETTTKPKLIRNRLCSESQSSDICKDDDLDTNVDSDQEVEILDDDVDKQIDLSSDTEIIDVDSTKIGEPIDIVDLSDDNDDDLSSPIELDKNVCNIPDVVASCHKSNKSERSEEDIIHEIDALVNDESKILIS